MVEGAPLLREYTRKGIVGSNPIFSAISRKTDFQNILISAPRYRAIAAPCFIVSL